ncbi:MAG: aldo/keto reductase [Silvanigrellaceae bacterium]|nr:aldo/keto reductase [Silvanigrellaceae bacterium]
MKFAKLGVNGPTVSKIGVGCMGMVELYGKPQPKEVVIKTIQTAYYEHQINFFDTADMYGKGLSEQVLGEAVASFRNEVVIATKCGLFRTDSVVGQGLATDTINTPEYIYQACDLSLKNLGMEYIDVYYLHRHDLKTPIETVMGAMSNLINAGKIHYVGLSEVCPETIRRAHAVLGDKLVAVQSEYSFMNRGAANAVLPVCRELGISFVPYSPFARGLLTGGYRNPSFFGSGGYFDIKALLPQYKSGNIEKNLELVDEIGRIAAKKQATPAQYALAWLLSQSDIFPIPGTSSIQHLKENVKAVEIELSPEEISDLEFAYNTHPIQGPRLPEELLVAEQLAP